MITCTVRTVSMTQSRYELLRTSDLYASFEEPHMHPLPLPAHLVVEVED
jgi:hypothetical protein